ncbi:hypothetical protein ACFQ3J_12745 [Paenibacillus provencensis]|uniref:Uncharacterized protein n=1 Tax=Paenibacillus provencensis TaxID=441151 RepID=A0ABW3PUL1_9BACL|nr:hypothetical protein [Paenibacillus sp. MER 78]MCM3127508.1 hypothetical protein [Paenibacillus sp. MER 78]
MKNRAILDGRKKKYKIVLIIGLLIFLGYVLAVLAGIFSFQSQTHESMGETTPNEDVKMYILRGSGDLWDVKDYTILIGAGQIMRGKAQLSYMGDSEDLQKIRHFDVSFYEQLDTGSRENVFGWSAKAVDEASMESIDIEDNVKQLGTNTGSYAYDELKKNADTYESTAVLITWEDIEGRSYSDTVELSISHSAELLDKP